MSQFSRKIVAVLMLLWLPLFAGNALATAVSMQMPHGSCQEADAMQSMEHEDIGEHHHSDMQMSSAGEEDGASCNSCGICHLGCSSYLAMTIIGILAVQADALSATPYLVTYKSVSSAPLTPPPSPRV
ncbi:MAG: DUF2946 domain-containing protein [Nitrosomonadales bacterium]|nr:DUF2946 domain-containing protein [Nitrosomonadales bacterium]